MKLYGHVVFVKVLMHLFRVNTLKNFHWRAKKTIVFASTLPVVYTLKTLRTFLVGFSSFLLLLVAPDISSRTFLASVVTDSSSELSLSDSSSSSVVENRLAPDFLEEAESLLPFSGSPLLPGVPEQEETDIMQ